MFGPEVEATIVAHARAEYARAACGLVVDGVYVPVENRARDPHAQVLIPVGETLRAGVQAVGHSPPDGDPWPSAEDIAGQVAPRCLGTSPALPPLGPAGCSGGNDVPRPPLPGREFRLGPSGSDGRGDCYALIRDWFWDVRSIDLPEFPRAPEWWLAGGDLYRDGFARAGFREIDLAEIAPGDVVLAKAMSPVPNHGGVVLADGLVRHHLTGRLSRREPLGPWRRFVTHALRWSE